MRRQLHLDWKVSTSQTFILNLDSEFHPYKFQTNTYFLEFKKFTFKGGEPHFQITSDVLPVGDLVITQRYNKVDDLVKIILANDAARRMGFKNIKLFLPYFPAARQDRVCNSGEPLTIKVFTEMINSCGFDEVIILCPHSDVTPALINNVTVLDELNYVDMVINSLYKSSRDINIVCPDAGAGKRVNKIVQHLSNNDGHVNFNLIRCEKIRDVKDGAIKEFFVDAENLGEFPTIICDDINSMAGTFLGLGKKLKEKNCGALMLYTSHSDCVEGIQRAIEYFDHVYTTNSKQNWDKYTYTIDNRLTCFNIEERYTYL